MPRYAAILVSTGGAAYSNPSLFQQILLQAGKAEEVYLVIGDSLNRWNLLPVCRDMDVALRRSIESGDKWCATFIETAKKCLGQRFKGVYRWEDWRQNKKMEYEQKRSEFNGICNKAIVMDILRGILAKHGIASRDDFVAKIDVLKKEKGLLLGNRDWQQLSWENAIAATILEYSCRHFQSTSVDFTEQPKSNFAEFLVTYFFPSAYEHQAEEAVMLYRCLIPANIRFDVLYYPNKISPIFKKAHLEFAEHEKLMYWSEIKVDSKKEDEIEHVIRMYFAGVQGMSRGDKEMLANLIRPLLAFVTTHKQQDQSALLVTITGLCGIFPQFIASVKKGYTPAFFSGAVAQSYDAATNLQLVRSPALSPPPSTSSKSSVRRDDADTKDDASAFTFTQ